MSYWMRNTRKNRPLPADTAADIAARRRRRRAMDQLGREMDARGPVTAENAAEYLAWQRRRIDELQIEADAGREKW